MRVFLTGATGFIGAYLVPELIGAGHQVVGLTRSEAGAAALSRAGAEPLRGDLADLDGLAAAAADAEGVIHTAFDHDFSDGRRHSEADRRIVQTLGEALLGSDRPFLVASGTGLVDRSDASRPAAETDDPAGSAIVPRAATEEAAAALAARGGRVMVVRLSQVHDTRRQGRIALHIQLARQKGWVAYVGAGENRLAAVHVSDAVRLFRLALEKGRAGARYHAVDEEGVAMRDIAEAIGAQLGLPVRSIVPEETADYFGPIAGLATLDLAASSVLTREALAWRPSGPDLLSDLRRLEDAASPASAARG
jgi:nucleoside-diphosphate-sugar epimerase